MSSAVLKNKQLIVTARKELSIGNKVAAVAKDTCLNNRHYTKLKNNKDWTR